MLEDESIIELMLAIGQHDFFVGEALLVVKNGDGFTVVEGNRRLTSLKLLSNPSLATIRVNRINFICCMIYPYKLFVFLVYLILDAGLLLPSKHLNMKLYQYF
jgi:hypothetical protein